MRHPGERVSPKESIANHGDELHEVKSGKTKIVVSPAVATKTTPPIAEGNVHAENLLDAKTDQISPTRTPRKSSRSSPRRTTSKPRTRPVKQKVIYPTGSEVFTKSLDRKSEQLIIPLATAAANADSRLRRTKSTPTSPHLSKRIRDALVQEGVLNDDVSEGEVSVPLGEALKPYTKENFVHDRNERRKYFRPLLSLVEQGKRSVQGNQEHIRQITSEDSKSTCYHFKIKDVSVPTFASCPIMVYIHFYCLQRKIRLSEGFFVMWNSHLLPPGKTPETAAREFIFRTAVTDDVVLVIRLVHMESIDSKSEAGKEKKKKKKKKKIKLR